MMRIPAWTLGVFGLLTLLLMTVSILFLGLQENQERLTSIQGVVDRDVRLDVTRKSRALGHALASPVVAHVRSGTSTTHLIRSLALSSGSSIIFSYGDRALTVDANGRDVRLNGHSVDDMSRQELLQMLHEIGRRFSDLNR
jgi:hypothetical protein